MILRSNKKRHGSEAPLSPSEVRVIAGKRQISAGSSLKASSPDAVITQLALRLFKWGQLNEGRVGQGAGSHRLQPRLTATAVMSRGKDQGEVHRHLKDWARPVGGLGEGSRSLHDTAPSCFLGTPSSATGLRLGELEAPRKKARVHLFTPYKILMTITPLTPG